MDSTFFKALTNHPEIMPTIFESLPEPTFLINADGYYVEAWGGTDTKRHHNPMPLVGLHLNEILPSDKAVWFAQVIKEVLESHKVHELEYELNPAELKCFDGVDGPTEKQFFSAFVVPLAGEKHVLWTIRNITEYKLAQQELAIQQQRLERLSNIDHLTQSYNRFALDKLLPEVLDKTRARQHSGALFMIDIDCFKNLNDYYGHLQGDEALIKVASTIQEWANEDGYCFRFGGDEFLVFRANLTREQCYQDACELSQSIKA
ncbi:diguanylate cyclase, partial [Vibrio makurazakiensis]|uniref:sensor domain-containing diguanylate cyclase n=1 Tax=Vibrio makurazakiensis TaxID=2910250 RepID=UPI003D0F8C7A